MSRIGAWAVSVLTGASTTNVATENGKRDVCVQTFLSASANSILPNDWLFRETDDGILDIDFISEEFNDSDSDMQSRKRKRRIRIPDKPNQRLSLWSVLKDAVGQNLASVALPVNFNEPLSVLQRMTEPFEYSFLLDKAADCKNVYDQISYLSAFCISSYSTSSERTGKPFNPLLGETYEFDRSDDLGWRCIAEQISHRPSISALHCESNKWVCWEELAGNMLFRGKYIRLTPDPCDRVYVKFKTNQKTYRLGRAETLVHNVVFGKVWLDHCGDVDIIALDDTVKTSLTFVPYSSFSRGAQRKVYGAVTDASKVKRLIRGFWNQKVDVAFNLDDDSGEMNNATAKYETIWECRSPKHGSEKYYNFTEFACELNEFESGVAPTDSRLRPDLRLMEESKWDKANEVKLQLEEKQRQVIYRRETENAALILGGNPSNVYTPIWFVKTKDTQTHNGEFLIHVYNGEYWEAKKKADWSNCPDIYI